LADKAWTPAEDEKLRAAVKAEGPRNWRVIAEKHLGGAWSDTQALNRWFKVLRPGLVKGPWAKEEDEIIIQCMATGITKWSDIAERVPGRLGKQVRDICLRIGRARETFLSSTIIKSNPRLSTTPYTTSAASGG